MEGDTHASELLTSPAGREFVENAPDAVVVIGGDGCIMLVNTAAESMFGYRRNVLLGQQYTVLLPCGLTTRRRYVRDGVPSDAGIENRADLNAYGRRREAPNFLSK
ncbi:PAS domain-containing protein [Arthrobacter sp. RHLT1-20]